MVVFRARSYSVAVEENSGFTEPPPKKNKKKPSGSGGDLFLTLIKGLFLPRAKPQVEVCEPNAGHRCESPELFAAAVHQDHLPMTTEWEVKFTKH